uniref:Uncharacterized protein n=1 Tax=Arundo donax TaxID=35708 RepID=A0A0A9ERG5_ARUDO
MQKPSRRHDRRGRVRGQPEQPTPGAGSGAVRPVTEQGVLLLHQRGPRAAGHGPAPVRRPARRRRRRRDGAGRPCRRGAPPRR